VIHARQRQARAAEPEEGKDLVGRVDGCASDATVFGKKTIFDFARHRRIEHYGLITSQTGAVPPPEN